MNKLAVQPGPRAANATGIVPGLYPGEVAVTLPSGDLAAVYADSSPTDNNYGMAFYASARAINADGSTRLFGGTDTDPGVELVTETVHASCHSEVVSVGAQAIANELIKAVLGEALTMNPADPTQPLVVIENLDQKSIVNMISSATMSSTISAAGAT